VNIDDLKIFALDHSKEFGEKVAERLGIALSKHEERSFDDGEHKIRPLENIRNRDVFVIQSLYSDSDAVINEKLCRLLFFIGAAREGCAQRITAVCPYMCYARKDRQTKPRDPVTTKYVAQIFEAVGVNHILTMDIHNLQAYQNSFNCYNDHLEARNIFIDYFEKNIEGGDIAVMSPDEGGVKRSEKFRLSLSKRLGKDIPLTFMEKQRSEGEVTGEAVVGEVKNKTVIIVDDMVSSGTTPTRAAKACKKRNAKRILAAVTHPIFTEAANDALRESSIDKIITTNTRLGFKLNQALLKEKVIILDTSPMFAEAIKRIHEGGSIVDLLAD